jgi:sulfatase maturation enzyme AslB (radical SAM superfamily)
VLTESGLHEAIALIDKFSPRVRKFKFFPRVPRNKNDLLLNGSSYNKRVAEFYSSLGVLANVRPELDLLTPMPIRLDNALGDRLIGDTKCICTATKLYIDAQLDVYPCYYSASHANRIGSCDNSSISSLWISHKAQELRRLASESRLCGAGFGKNEIPSRYISLDKIRVDDSNGSAPISFK